MNYLYPNIEKLEFYRNLNDEQQIDFFARIEHGIDDIQGSLKELSITNTRLQEKELTPDEVEELMADVKSHIAHILYHIFDMKIFENEVQQALASIEDN